MKSSYLKEAIGTVKAKLANTQVNRRELTFASVAFLLALAVRLILAPYTGHSYDINVHIIWLGAMENVGPFLYISSEGMGLMGPEWGHNPRFCELPPMFPLFLYLSGITFGFPARQPNPYVLVLTTKLPQIVAESMLATSILLVARRLGGGVATWVTYLVFALNPAALFLTSIWGIPDAILGLFLFLSVYAAYNRKIELSAYLMSAALATKPYPIILLLPLSLYVKSMGYKVVDYWKNIIFSGIVVVSPWIIFQTYVFIEAMVMGAMHNLGIRVLQGVVWAYPSFWALVGGLVSESTYAFIAVCQFPLFLVGLSVFTLLLWKRGLLSKSQEVFFVCAIYILFFMMFMPAAHEKWEYAALPLLAIAPLASSDRHLKTSAVVAYIVSSFAILASQLINVDYYYQMPDVLPTQREFPLWGWIASPVFYSTWYLASQLFGGKWWLFWQTALDNTLCFILVFYMILQIKPNKSNN